MPHKAEDCSETYVIHALFTPSKLSDKVRHDSWEQWWEHFAVCAKQVAESKKPCVSLEEKSPHGPWKICPPPGEWTDVWVMENWKPKFPDTLDSMRAKWEVLASNKLENKLISGPAQVYVWGGKQVHSAVYPHPRVQSALSGPKVPSYR